jgi:hypothetical protein
MVKTKYLAVSILSVLIIACVALSAAETGANPQSIEAQLQNGAISGATAPMITQPTAVSGLTLRYTFTGDKYNYVVAGMGVRNTGRGTISVMRPSGTSLVAAYLYWTILDGTTPSSDNTKITINGVKVTGTMIGSGPSPAWTPPMGYTYRASVSSLLYPTEGSGGVSYGLEIGGINTITYTGASPWKPVSTATRMAESVHLIIVFKDPGLAGPTTVRIYDGYYEQSGGVATFVYNWPVRAAGTFARFSHLLADGQEMNVPAFSKRVDLTVAATTTTIDGAGALNGNDPSLTSRATYEGSLSDTDTYNVGSLVPVAGGASTITWQLSNDCISWAGMVFATGVDAP